MEHVNGPGNGKRASNQGGREHRTLQDMGAQAQRVLGNSVVQRLIFEGKGGKWEPYCARSDPNTYPPPAIVQEGKYFDSACDRIYTREQILPIRLRRAQKRAQDRVRNQNYKNVVDYYGDRSSALQMNQSYEITTPFGSCRAVRSDRGFCIEPRYSYQYICGLLDGIQSVGMKRGICGLILRFLGSTPEENMDLEMNRKYEAEIMDIIAELEGKDFLALNIGARIRIFRIYCDLRQGDRDFLESMGMYQEAYRNLAEGLREVRDAVDNGAADEAYYDGWMDRSIDLLQDEREEQEEAQYESFRHSAVFSLMSRQGLDEDEAEEAFSHTEEADRRPGGGSGDAMPDREKLSQAQKVEIMDGLLSDMPARLQEVAQFVPRYAYDPLLLYNNIPENIVSAANVLCGILAAAESSPLRNPTGGKWERAAMRKVEKNLSGWRPSPTAFASVFCGGDAPYVPSHVPEADRAAADSRYPLGGTQQGRNFISGNNRYETGASANANLAAGEHLLSDESDSSEDEAQWNQ